MSDWTYSCCNLCWLAREGERIPRLLRNTGEQVCCFCGDVTESGIYVRENPAVVRHCPGHGDV